MATTSCTPSAATSQPTATVLGLFSGRKLRQSPPGVGTCRVGEARLGAGERRCRAATAPCFRLPRRLAGRVQARPARRPLQAHGGQSRASGSGTASQRRSAWTSPASRTSTFSAGAAQPVTTEGKHGRWAITLLGRREPGAPAAAVRRARLLARRLEARGDAARPRPQGGAALIPPVIERRASWVLDTLGAGHLGIGDLPYSETAWRAVDAGRRPQGNDLAEAFFHLARIEERNGPRDEHGRFPVSATCLDPLDPPLERLRRRLGRGAAALGRRPLRRRAEPRRGHSLALDAEGRSSGRRPAEGSRAWAERRCGLARGAWACRSPRPPRAWDGPQLLLRAHRRHRAVARRLVRLLPARGSPRRAGRPRARRLRPAAAARRRDAARAPRRDRPPRELHSCVRCQPDRRGEGRARAPRRDAPRTALPLPARRSARGTSRRSPSSGFAYDSSLGFGGAPGFRAGIAHPFRPWDFEHDRPLDLVEIPLAVMDVTLAEPRYLGLSVKEAERRLLALLDWAARARRRLLDPLAHGSLRPGDRRRLGSPLRAADRCDSRTRRRLHAREGVGCRGRPCAWRNCCVLSGS